MYSSAPPPGGLSKARLLETVEPEISAREPLAAAVILASNPLFSASVCGMTVLTRMVSALRQAGVSRILILSPLEPALPAARGSREKKSDVVWLEPRSPSTRRELRSLREAGGQVLLLLSPVVLDKAAVEFLLGARASAGSGLSLFGSSGLGAELAGLLLGPDELELVSEALISACGRAGVLALASRFPPIQVTAGVFYPMVRTRDRRSAQASLLKSLTRPTDGFLARWIDRRLSSRLSAVLVQTPVTPNQITLFTLVPALVGAVFLSFPSPLWSAAGAFLFWCSTVLDGCDGEIARLKHQESERGARLDILCDNVALVAVFFGIVVHVYFEDRRMTVGYLAAAIFVGMLGCMITEYVRIIRPRMRLLGRGAPLPESLDSGRVRWYERLASRDFAYALPFLAYFGLLRYLVWATAIGVNVFWLALVAVVLARPRSQR